MNSLGRRWAGHLYGTNTGNVFADLTTDGQKVTGTVRYLDTVHGLSVFAAEGAFDDGVLRLSCTVTQGSEDLEFGEITLHGRLNEQGNLRGDWSSTLGTAGTFVLFPHVGAEDSDPRTMPERVHSASKELGALRLDASDVRGLIQAVGQSFKGLAPVVAYVDGGLEVIRFAPDFEKELSQLGQLSSLRISLQAPEQYGVNRSVLVDLSAVGQNHVRVQGVDRTWVTGTAELLTERLKRRERWLLTGIHKWGLNANSLILLAAVAVLPDLTLVPRLAFMAFVALTVLTVAGLHRRFVPNLVISLNEGKRGWAARPQLLSGIIMTLSGLAVAVVYGLLSGDLSLPSWLVARPQ